MITGEQVKAERERRPQAVLRRQPHDPVLEVDIHSSGLEK